MHTRRTLYDTTIFRVAERPRAAMNQPENLPIPAKPVVTQDTKGRLVTTSRNVAEVTGKQHFHVIRDIDAIRESHPNLDGLMFQEVTAFDPAANRDVRSFEMTRDGMALLVMGYTTPRAMEFKLAFLAKFNEMEEELRWRKEAPEVLQAPQQPPQVDNQFVLQVLQANQETTRLMMQQMGQMFAQALQEVGKITPAGPAVPEPAKAAPVPQEETEAPVAQEIQFIKIAHAAKYLPKYFKQETSHAIAWMIREHHPAIATKRTSGSAHRYDKEALLGLLRAHRVRPR